MGILTTLKETFVGDDTETSGETATERDRSASPDQSRAETELVVGKGDDRNGTLLKLVRSRGGRIQQAELVTLTGWSKSAVSRRLSELETDGTITRQKYGRCKVVFLSDDPHLSDSPSVDDIHQ